MPISFRFVSSGQAVADAMTVAQTLRGNSLKPLSPVNLRGSRNAAGDLLIQWDRRSRIGAGLRPSAGVPIAEEKIIYELEVYNGSAVVDTWRVSPIEATERPIWNIIQDSKLLTSTSVDGTVSISGIGGSFGDVLILSQQRLLADEVNLVSFNVNAVEPSVLPRNVGLLSESSLSGGLSGVEPDFGWRRGTTGQVLTIDDDPNLTPYISEVARTNLTIRMARTKVDYYQDRIDDSSSILKTAPTAASGAYRLYIREQTPNGTTKTITDLQIQRTMGLARYSVDQQVLRFGSAQSAIKVRVRQISALVGRGNYAEATI